ncbi:MAG TPA: alcohol dehydrogenase catalytic domain-containing protein [Candidatus Solibacter sp.]|nr:alcohol dehydrogenase catalytic domain-containing protein [Candidatus Solibacter sp.]
MKEPRGPIAVERHTIAEPASGEALLRVEACGLCHSDLFVCGLAKLPMAPLRLGHEGIGRVETVGPDVLGWKPGDRAGITFLGTTCGACEWCKDGRERFCPKQTNFGYTLQGALGDRVVVPAAGLVPVPDDLPAEIAAPLCCAGWTAFAALREAALAPGQRVALFGFGGLGHLALQIARHQGLLAAVADPSPEKMDAARAAGAEIEAKGADAAVVFTGAAKAIPDAFRVLRRNGTLVLVGLSVSNYELPLVDTVLKGITIRGSYLGSRDDLAQVFALARSGAIRPHVHTHSIEETPALLDRMSRGEVLGRAVVAFC